MWIMDIIFTMYSKNPEKQMAKPAIDGTIIISTRKSNRYKKPAGVVKLANKPRTISAN